MAATATKLQASHKRPNVGLGGAAGGGIEWSKRYLVILENEKT